MDYLFKAFQKMDQVTFEREYNQRFNFPTSVKLDLTIKPINNSKEFTLYYLPTQRIHNLIAQIYENDHIIQSYVNRLPSEAQHRFILESIADELLNTNEIEGVRSTREEIVRSVRNLDSEKKEKDRFSSMVQSYYKLSSSELTKIDKPKDIRKIFDLLLSEEIEDEDLPDGEIFRAETNQVLKKSGTQKVIHKGVFPEEKIIKKIHDLIEYLNDEEEHLLIRIAVTHYYFGYIHPFYDGNGRTSRFISSMYLKQKFSALTAISLSRGSNKQKSKYLDAFENTNKVINRGELNFFIESFLEILEEAQQEVIAQLKEKSFILDEFYQQLVNDKYFDDKANYIKDIFFILGQDTLFSSDIGLTVSNLAELLNVSEQTVRKILGQLYDEGKVDYKGSKPKFYFVSDKYFE